MSEYVRPMDLHSHNDGCELYGCTEVVLASEHNAALLRLSSLQKQYDAEMEAHASLQARCFDYGNPTHTSIFDERDMLRSRLDAIREWLGEGRWDIIIGGIEKELHKGPVVEKHVSKCEHRIQHTELRCSACGQDMNSVVFERGSRMLKRLLPLLLLVAFIAGHATANYQWWKAGHRFVQTSASE